MIPRAFMPTPCWGFTRTAKTSTYAVTAVDRGYTIDCTSGTFSVTLAAAATLGSGFSFAVYNSGSGVITVDPNGSETIRSSAGSATTLVLNQGQGVLLMCDGVGFDAVAGAGLPVSDNLFRVVGSADATKQIAFEADTQTTGFTFTWDIGAQTASRTLSVPVLSGADTIGVLGVTATWTGLQTFGNAQTIFGLNSGAVELRVNGGNSGSNNGGRCTVWNNGSSVLQFGNKSAILGGAYDATPYFYSNGTVEFADTIRMTDAKNIILQTTTGTKIGTATTQKLGFWNATPVVQPATTGTATGFTAGAGTAVNDASTFTGGTGSAAYRISDIVLALKQIGALAS